MSNPNLITVKETAEYLNIPLPTVYYLAQRGQIPAVQIGGRLRRGQREVVEIVFRENPIILRVQRIVAGRDEP